MKDKKTSFDEEIYSSNVGFNLINKTQFISLDVPSISFSWQYTEKNDIFIPKQYSIFHFPSDTIIKYHLQHSEINIKLPNNIFSITALGIKDNDILLNFQEKTNYIFKKGKMVKLCNFNEKPDEAVLNIKTSTEFSTFRIFLMITGFALICLGIILKLRKK
jgi:hypothetical protein